MTIMSLPISMLNMENTEYLYKLNPELLKGNFLAELSVQSLSGMEINKDKLAEDWERAKEHRPLKKIPPLE
jgi:hypothetical protein